LTKVQKAKARWEKLQKISGKASRKHLEDNGKESFNGTPKPITMGCWLSLLQNLGVVH
jgi:hypothetical protein